MKKIIVLLFLVTFISLSLTAQEVVSGLNTNPKITNHIYHNLDQNINLKELSEESMSLPFFDDFKYDAIFPIPSLWIDNEAFVNSDNAYRSANRGAATLDAINHIGELYDEASSFAFIADHLTSRRIRLDSIFESHPISISIADSLYLSFFYQPQGRGDAPNPKDSLVLEFGYIDSTFIEVLSEDFNISDLGLINEGDTIFPGQLISINNCGDEITTMVLDTFFYNDIINLPCDSVYEEHTNWIWQWSSEGMSLEEFHNTYGTYSKQVMIPITDSLSFYNKNFQFRFFNYASIASTNIPSWRSNADFWNIDYVYLNTQRTLADTFYQDISFAERAPSMLKRFESMPYRQYRVDPTNEIRTSYEMFITNLDNVVYNTNYKFDLISEDLSYSRTYDGGFCNLFPFTVNGFQSCQECAQHACPPYNFLFPLNLSTDKTSFSFTHILVDNNSDDLINDTVVFDQIFSNYYAYDDGTPEAGYGLTPEGAKFAYKFELNETDTLTAVKFFFNHTAEYANEKYFNIAVWDDNNGTPGDLLYVQNSMKPIFEDSLNVFHTYVLNEAVLINNVFYIGWIQQDDENLNIGLDRYNDRSEYMFYNATGVWEESMVEGSVMIRPIVGNLNGDGQIINEPKSQELEIFPNPNKTGSLKISLPQAFINSESSENLVIEIYNLYGQSVKKMVYKDQFPIDFLSKGIYLVRLSNINTNESLQSKLIIP